MHALIDFHALQSLLQDISSHQRMVDSVVEKAQGVLQATNNPEVAAFITEISSRYEHIARTAKVTKIKRSSLLLCQIFNICKCEPYLISQERDFVNTYNDMYNIVRSFGDFFFYFLLNRSTSDSTSRTYRTTSSTMTPPRLWWTG